VESLFGLVVGFMNIGCSAYVLSQEIVKDGEYFKEQSLMFDKSIKILDLLIKKDNEYLICDYKTTTAKSSEHKSQVGFYKKAIENITKSDDVKSFIIYLQKDIIEIVEAR
jgi:exodeoxyribonuclease V beta subunit